MATKTIESAETMTAAEFKVLRERLGLPAAWMARSLGTFERTLSRWETGAHPVREDAVALLREMEDHTDKSVASAVLRHKAGAVLKTFRYDANVPTPVKLVDAIGAKLPASWHRAMIGRVAAELDGEVGIVYDD